MNFLNRHEDYSNDEILDMYNKTGNKKYLTYMFIKKNNLMIHDISMGLEVPWERVAVYLFNIQRELDYLETAMNFKDIERLLSTDYIDDTYDDEVDF